MQEISTRSPGLNMVQPGPTLSTTPIPSCPRMRPGAQLGTSPFRMCRSVPQIVVLAIFDDGVVRQPAVAGLGRSSRAFEAGTAINQGFHDGIFH